MHTRVHLQSINGVGGSEGEGVVVAEGDNVACCEQVSPQGSPLRDPSGPSRLPGIRLGDPDSFIIDLVRIRSTAARGRARPPRRERCRPEVRGQQQRVGGCSGD